MDNKNIKFSIVTVCLNAGQDLTETINSALAQTYSNFEIIIKDGFSNDGSIEKLPKDDRIKLYIEKDKGIYDAMNQAINYCTGDYIYFLNCGDLFFNDEVLKDISEYINKYIDSNIVYGHTFRDNIVNRSPKMITKFFFFRNTLCHQACFYKRELYKNYGLFDTEYKIYADNEHMIRMLNKEIKFNYIDKIISIYKGDGFSEQKTNLKLKNKEKMKLNRKQYSLLENIYYNFIWKITFPEFRNKIIGNKIIGRIYIKIRNRLYK